MSDTLVEILRALQARVRELPSTIQERQTMLAALAEPLSTTMLSSPRRILTPRGPLRGRSPAPASASLAPPPIFLPLQSPSTAGSKRVRSDSSASSDSTLAGDSEEEVVFYDGYIEAFLEAVIRSLPRPQATIRGLSSRFASIGLESSTTRPEEETTPREEEELRPEIRFHEVLGKAVPITTKIAYQFLRGRDCSKEAAALGVILGEVAELVGSHGARAPQIRPEWSLEVLEDWRQNKYDGVLGDYTVGEKIKAGSFGVVYHARTRSGNKVAIKMEGTKSRYSLQRDEIKVYKALKGCVGVAALLDTGENRFLRYMVITLLGPSLEDLFHRCQHRFDLKTVAIAAMQMISRVQTVHDEGGRVHRDIKPDNFLLDTNTINIVDFGLAKEHLPLGKARTRRPEDSLPTGTVRYMSVDAHLWREQYRKDDMRALGNVFVYFLRGKLPWMGLKVTPWKGATPKEVKREKYRRILETKQSYTTEALCQDLPDEVRQYMVYVDGLRYEDKPDYDLMRSFFQSGMDERGEANDGQFCWLRDGAPPRARSRHT